MKKKIITTEQATQGDAQFLQDKMFWYHWWQ